MTVVRNETQRHSATLKNAGQNPIGLFPLDGRGRLGRNVVAHAVGAGNLGNNAAGDAGQHVVGQLGPVAVIASLDSTARRMIGRW